MKFLIDLDAIEENPRECHECPLQLKFKDDEVDDWYMRRCVIANRTIQYPKPNWCPLIPVEETAKDGEQG